jgi:hypothetical protein
MTIGKQGQNWGSMFEFFFKKRNDSALKFQEEQLKQAQLNNLISLL